MKECFLQILKKGTIIWLPIVKVWGKMPYFGDQTLMLERKLELPEIFTDWNRRDILVSLQKAKKLPVNVRPQMF